MQTQPFAAMIARVSGETILALDETRLAAYGETARAPVETRREGQVAVIPVHGVLMPRGGRSLWGGSWNGMDNLRAQIAESVRNPDVSAIVLDVDSPGGTVAGTEETAQAVRAAAAQKPVVAIANGLAASAAYWIASQASELVVAPGSDVGSIGVIQIHMSVARMYADIGLDTTVIRAGKYKAEGNPFEALTEDARANMQARVDASYKDFVAAVAEGRKASAKRVMSDFGEGRVVDAKSAVVAGMADRVAALGDVIAQLTAGKGRAFRRRSSLSFA